jgi:ribonucleoside-diphosphate reductase alpha chain
MDALTSLGSVVPHLADLYDQVIGHSVTDDEMRELYQLRFPAYIELGIAFRRLDPRLRDFDLPRLALAIDITRDGECGFAGMRTLCGAHYELPQWFWMRVAMGLALTETDADPTARAIDWYHALSTAAAPDGA